jgi:hypothetical protein
MLESTGRRGDSIHAQHTAQDPLHRRQLFGGEHGQRAIAEAMRSRVRVWSVTTWQDFSRRPRAGMATRQRLNWG